MDHLVLTIQCVKIMLTCIVYPVAVVHVYAIPIATTTHFTQLAVVYYFYFCFGRHFFNYFKRNLVPRASHDQYCGDGTQCALSTRNYFF